MKRFKLTSTDMPPEMSVLLFTAWVQFFSEQRLGIQQHGGGPTQDGSAIYNFGDRTKVSFALEPSPNGQWSLKSSQGASKADLEAIVADARQKHRARDMGGEVVYQTTMKASGYNLSPVGMSQFMRILGDQVPIHGSRRLGSRVLLEFTPEQSSDLSVPQLFAPATDIEVSILPLVLPLAILRNESRQELPKLWARFAPWPWVASLKCR